MKKIGVVTIYDVTNYGNRLQNYAVVTILEKLGFKVKTITPTNWLGMLYKSDRYGKPIENIEKKPAEEEKKDIMPASKAVLWDRLKMISPRLFYSIMFSLRYTPSVSVDKLTDEYDCFVCGSDQIWNPDFSGQEFFFAGFSQDARKIAYSASFGVSELSDRVKALYSACLKDFYAVSVREHTGKKLVEEISGKQATVVLDPTMMLDSRQWKEIEKKPAFKLHKEYIFAYILGEIPENERKYMSEIAAENNLELVVLEENNKIWNKVGPCEFIWLISHSKAVITDSFHGMVFSILNSRPFIALDRKWSFKSMNSRIDTLLSMFGLEECRFKNQSAEELFSQDFTEVALILEEKRKESLGFLCEALDINYE